MEVVFLNFKRGNQDKIGIVSWNVIGLMFMEYDVLILAEKKPASVEVFNRQRDVCVVAGRYVLIDDDDDREKKSIQKCEFF